MNLGEATLTIGADTEPLRTELEGIEGVMSDAVTTTLGHLGNAFEEFARTGELNVRNMVNAIVADLARIVFDDVLKEPMGNFLQQGLSFATSLFGGGGKIPGGSGKPILVPPGKALGGSASFGKPYVVGEQGRELFVPETSGRIVPNGGVGGNNITFNVQASDASSFQRSETQIAAMLNRAVGRGNRNL